MKRTTWGIIFVTCNVICANIFRAIIMKRRIQMKPLQGHIPFCYAVSAPSLLIIALLGIMKPQLWHFVMIVHGVSATAPIIVLIMYVINKWFDLHMENLTVAVKTLRRVQMVLHRLDPLQSSEAWMEWLDSVDNLQRRMEVLEAGYYGRSINILKKRKFSTEAEQELQRANNLLRLGDSLLHPQKHLRGTMKFYRKKMIDFIEDMNIESGLLGIWGMGGVGKSSLVKLVCDSRLEYDDDSFKSLFIVRAGIGCTIGKVQEAIATSMGLPLERNETSQAKIIQDHLNDKSFLLLLDDLWGYLDLKAVGIPSPLGMAIVSLPGGLERQIRRKVVFTTRNMTLCHEMGCHLGNTIQMECFSEEDAWRIYHQMVRENRLLAENPSSSVIATQENRLLPEKPSGHVVIDKSLPGMKDAYKKVCGFIDAMDTEPCLIGVWGMRGVGKTALLRLVRDSYTDNVCFDHIMFVGAGTGCMVKNVQHAMAINLGIDWAMMSSLDELSRAAHISNHLEDKTFLLLLDDIREPLNWKSIGLPTLSSRRKIIFAMRSMSACALMGRRFNNIEMKCLGEDDAWRLFRDKVGLGIIDDHPEIHHLAEQMVSLCGGLPLALCALGRAMSNKRDPREWRTAYNQLRDMHLDPCAIDDKVATAIFIPRWTKRSEDTSHQENVGTPIVSAQMTPSSLPSVDRRTEQLRLRR